VKIGTVSEIMDDFAHADILRLTVANVSRSITLLVDVALFESEPRVNSPGESSCEFLIDMESLGHV
jgi:hypothetical protein